MEDQRPVRATQRGFGRPLRMRHQAQHGAALAYDPGIAEGYLANMKEDVDLWALWDKIACPVLVLRGAVSDVLTADTAKKMQARGPKAKVVEFAGTGHAPALVSEDQIAAIRDWLAQTA